MNRKQKLELTWIGKDVRPRLEPRSLLEDLPAAGNVRQVGHDLFDNRLILDDTLPVRKYWLPCSHGEEGEKEGQP